jgi:hypothetical protein
VAAARNVSAVCLVGNQKTVVVVIEAEGYSRCGLVCLDGILGALEGVHGKLLDISLGGDIVVHLVLGCVVALEPLQLVHQVCRVGHAFVRLGVQALVEDGIDDQVFTWHTSQDIWRQADLFSSTYTSRLSRACTSRAVQHAGHSAICRRS